VTVECTACGNEAQIRFEPDPTRPVYCNDCFSVRKTGNRRPVAAQA
jgi:CxxC-x17-CxxC domain-containing protein